MDERVQRPETHEYSLADRLVTSALREWIDLKIGLAFATSEKSDHPGIQRADDCLTGYWYEFTPRLLDQLRRAGLLRPDVDGIDRG